jgi:hypothetical protein
VALACGGEEPGPAEADLAARRDSVAADSTAHAAGAEEPTRIEIVGVDLHILGDAVARVERLEGTVVGDRPGEPIPLDDASRYTIEVENGVMFVGYDDLSRVMNEYTLKGGPIGGIVMAREEDEDERGRVELKGRLRSGLGLSFEIEGTPEPMPDGRIRIRTEAIQALEIPVGGLMHALGLEPGDIMSGLEERGLAFDGDDMILDASRALPPPRIHGAVTSVRVEDRGLRMTYGSARPAPESRRNYLHFRHGVIKIGRMDQYDADLTITDADPRDPFDFYGEQMNRQLAAGYSKMSEAGALTMFIPDYADMARGVDLP